MQDERAVTSRETSPYAIPNGISWAIASVVGWLSLFGVVQMGWFVLCESLAFGLIWPTAAGTRPGYRWLGVIAGLVGFWTAGIQTYIGVLATGIVLALVTICVGAWMMTTRSPFSRFAAAIAFISGGSFFIVVLIVPAAWPAASSLFAVAFIAWLVGNRFVRQYQ